jgi:hypothetical protein
MRRMTIIGLRRAINQSQCRLLTPPGNKTEICIELSVTQVTFHSFAGLSPGWYLNWIPLCFSMSILWFQLIAIYWSWWWSTLLKHTNLFNTQLISWYANITKHKFIY